MADTTNNRFPQTMWGLISKVLVEGFFASFVVAGITVLAALIFGFPEDVFIDGETTTSQTLIAVFVGLVFLGLAVFFIAAGYLTGPFRLLFHAAAVVMIGIALIGSLSAGFFRDVDASDAPTDAADLVVGFAALSSALLAVYVWGRAREFRAGFPVIEPSPQDEVREVNDELPPFASPQ